MLGSFLSRNNDIGGYWGFGILRFQADQKQIARIDINLIHLDDLPLDAAVAMHQECGKLFEAMLASHGVDKRDIKSALITVEFGETGGLPEPQPHEWSEWGDPFLCTVYLEKSDGQVCRMSRLSRCGPCDPGMGCGRKSKIIINNNLTFNQISNLNQFDTNNYSAICHDSHDCSDWILNIDDTGAINARIGQSSDERLVFIAPGVSGWIGALRNADSKGSIAPSTNSSMAVESLNDAAEMPHGPRKANSADDFIDICDIESTQLAYSRYDGGCECGNCRNIQAQSGIVPDRVCNLLSDMGIDPQNMTEMLHYEKYKGKGRSVEIEWAFITRHGVALDVGFWLDIEGVRVECGSWGTPCPEFDGSGRRASISVQISDVPWVLDEPEDD